ncbi:MAG TPA: AAA domain-containing protein [Bacillota bacterium]
MALSSEELLLQTGEERLLKIFNYLKALNQYRNPIVQQINEQEWQFWLKNLPDHPAIKFNRVKFAANELQQIDEPSPDKSISANDYVLKVRRPKLTNPPEPPVAIYEWLINGWDDPNKECKVKDLQNKVTANGDTVIDYFANHQELVEEFERWKKIWQTWAANEKPARDCMKLFEQIYALYGSIQKEAEKKELILGDGILNWRYSDKITINHPILLQRLFLEFNPSIPEFTFSETEHEVELYTALFSLMPDVDGGIIARCREELTKGEFHPLGGEDTSGFLRRLVAQLSARGSFVEEGEACREEDFPQISRNPVIFMRNRTLGFSTALDSIIEDINNHKQLPSPLLKIAGINGKEDQTEENYLFTPEDNWKEPADILFGKNANPEQIRIARVLQKNDGVLVQGPPGTGKTHTIANLIGHLLAQGRSILVTSHTVKALRILRGQVAEEIRPLCVSVLDHSPESKQQLEQSIKEIVNRLNNTDVGLLANEAVRLEKERNALIAELAALRQKLIDSMQVEYRDVIVDGKGYSPSAAARIVAEGIGCNDWIPSPVANEPVPLTEEELQELYQTNTSLTKADESELSGSLPELNNLPSPARFREMVAELDRLLTQDFRRREKLWERLPSDETPQDLETLYEDLLKAVEPINSENSWECAVIMAGWKGGAAREPWDNLIHFIVNVREERLKIQEIIIRFQPKVRVDVNLEEQQKIVEAIIGFLANGKKINALSLMTHPSWKRFIENSQVRGTKPVKQDDFLALKTFIELKRAEDELKERWDIQLAPYDIPDSKQLGKEFFAVTFQYGSKVEKYLKWQQENWQPLEARLRKYGFRWDDFLNEQSPCYHEFGELIRLKNTIIGPLAKVIEERIKQIQYCRIEQTLKEKTDYLYSLGRSDSALVLAFLEAIEKKDSAQYGETYERLACLHKKKADLEKRLAWLERIHRVAPVWAQEIRQRHGIHGEGTPQGRLKDAWLWRLLHDELERSGGESLSKLQQEIEKKSALLRQTTNRLIEVKAWHSQIIKTSPAERSALIAYLQIINKIGKGKGKRAALLKNEARKTMLQCKNAVPVWIMPLGQVAEYFDPKTTNKFDVVIIDEASQCDLMGLIAFYLAKKVLVVGDNEQVSPDAVGLSSDYIQQMINLNLQGIPFNQLYDGQSSIYDIALRSFGGVISLREHFRCVPQIIQFSNKLSYNWQIKPLRDVSKLRIKPAVVPYRVKNAYSDGKVNQKEAITIASLLIAAIEQPEYEGKTFGVISLLGDDQPREIEVLLRNYLSEEVFVNRRIICGNPAHLQGDERDIIFLSMVYGPSADPPYKILGFGYNDMYKKRYNVAVSRARDQLWVVYSLDPQVDLKPGDLRRNLIEYAADPQAVIREMEQAESKTESPFEKEVLKRLNSAGYKVIPQWEVGAYRIDLVVEGGGRRLAIECDGDRHHPPEKIPEDMARQAILERLGWKFVRIRGSQFYRDPEQAMQPVWQRIAELGIILERDEANNGAALPEANNLLERVIRRAGELRQEWLSEVMIKASPEPVVIPKVAGLKGSKKNITDDSLE